MPKENSSMVVPATQTTEFFCKIVAEQLGLPFDQVKLVVDYSYDYARKALSDPKVRGVEFTGLMSLYFNAKRGRRRIADLEKKLDKNGSLNHLEEEELEFLKERCKDFDEKHKPIKRGKTRKTKRVPEVSSEGHEESGESSGGNFELS